MTHNLKNTEIEHVTLLALSREQDVGSHRKAYGFYFDTYYNGK